MAPIEGAQQLMAELGAQALSEDIRWETGVETTAGWVSMAFSPGEVDQETEAVEVLGRKLPALAIVTQGPDRWDMGNIRARMMNWIPEIKNLPPFETPEKRILSAFGILGLKNFKFLGREILVRQPIPATVMNLGINLGNEWIFDGYNRQNRESFSRLRETLWAIAMLPKSVVEEALNEGHFLLVSEMIGGAEGNGKGQITAMATVIKETDRVLVQDFSGRSIEDYGSGDGEGENPVLVLRYH